MIDIYESHKYFRSLLHQNIIDALESNKKLIQDINIFIENLSKLNIEQSKLK